jgi:hypothetical protein
MLPEPRSPAPLPPSDREGHVAHDGARRHFAPLQDPAAFDRVLLTFLGNAV